MANVFLDGQQNLSALQVPGLYIDIVPPQPFLTGVPTNIMGVVGAASWGPVNSPVFFSTPDGCAVMFGTPTSRATVGYKYDLASYVWAASQVGNAVAFCGVRVTDGTDVAATGSVQTNCLTLTSKYTGTLGNKIQFSIVTGTLPNSYMAIVAMPGRAPEQFNNITGSGNTLWLNIAAAINNGNASSGPSQIVTAAAGVGTTAPTLATPVTLTGGTDGATGVTDTALIGADTTPRTGMYALRRTGIDVFTLCDHSTSANWAVMASFALSESALCVTADASGVSLATTMASRVSTGTDSAWLKLLAGDWPYFYDSVNQLTRLVNPCAFYIGLAGDLSPEQSPINKPLTGVVATQKSAASQTYSDAELSQAELGGIDLIVGPPVTPGGFYYTFITGRTTSSNTAGNEDNWTRLTNFLARSLNSKAAGSIVGRLQSLRSDDQTRSDAKALVDGFLASLKDPAVGSYGNGIIEDFATQCDTGNNPVQLIVRGYLFLYAKVKYLNVVRYFVIKLAGGGNVTITSQSTPPSITQLG